MAGICPFCGRGPFQVLAGHTQKVHAVDRFELRELAGLTYSASLLDEATRAAFSARAKARLEAGLALPGGRSSGARRKKVSPAGRRIQAEKLRRYAEQLGAEGLARQRAAAGQRAAERSRKPHECPACGKPLPTANPVTCSPECRRVIRVRTAQASAAKRVASKLSMLWRR
jgi:predicted nucleic acid-binding Zn ribbon protein